MNRARSKNYFNKTMLSGAISAALSVGLSVTTAQADIYEFTFDNGGCAVGPLVLCGGKGDGVFTILNSGNAPTKNTSSPYYDYAGWGYGKRTQVGGSITIKETDGATQGKGVATINPFDFFASGSAVAREATLEDIGDGSGSLGTGSLWLVNMLFDWNGNNGIPVSLVWDLSGLFSGLSTLDVNDIANAGNVIDASGSVPGSDGISKGKFPIGPAPVASTTLDTTQICDTANSATYPVPASPDPAFPCLTTNPSGMLPVITDSSAIGASPMVDGPFGGFSANFDMTRLVLSGFNDTTPPVLSFSNASVSIDLSAAFDENNPGVTVTCTDAGDGPGSLTPAGGSSNANLSFTVNAADVAAINSTMAGAYSVRYSCTDSGSARSAIADDPENIGNPTIPADNTSADSILTVVVADPNAPVISITNDGQPTQHEACTVYNDEGATATDLQDDDATLTAAIVAGGDIASVNGLNLPDGTADAAITYDVTDTQANPVSGQFSAVTRTRTVTVSDTLPPVLAVTPTFAIESTTCMNFNANLPTATSLDANSCNPGPSPVMTASVVNCVVPDNQDTQDTTLLYSADDAASPVNTGTTSTLVTVSRSEPVITLLDEAGAPGGGGVVLDVGQAYVEFGIGIHDVQDGDLAKVTTSGASPGVGAGAGNLTYTVDSSSINIGVAGAYTVTYDVTDFDANAATQVTRTVTIGSAGAGSNFTMLDSDGKTFGGTNDVLFTWDGTSFNTDESDINYGLMTIATVKPQPFNSFFWTAHHVRVFGPGTYSFDTTCSAAQLDAGTTSCGGSVFLNMTVGTGQVGGHILFDWGKPDSASPCGVKSCDIDVVNVWDVDGVWDRHSQTATFNKLFDGQAGLPPDPDTTWALVSTDVNGDGSNGSPMVDGPFQNFYANFNSTPGATTGPREPLKINQGDTDLGGSSLASLNIMGIASGLFMLLGLRCAARRKKYEG